MSRRDHAPDIRQGQPRPRQPHFPSPGRSMGAGLALQADQDRLQRFCRWHYGPPRACLWGLSLPETGAAGGRGEQTGAGGTVAAQAVKASPPDGYTLLFALTVTMVQNRVLYRNLPYDPDKDFVLISTMSGGSAVLMAHKSTGATNMKEFVEYARRNRTNVGTWGAGSAPHMVIAELNKQFGLQMEAVHYGRSMWPDFDAGVIQAAQGGYYNTINSAQTGTGRVIAVWPRRTRKLPDVPTFAEQGVTSRLFGLGGYICLAGPSAMPREIVERLSTLMVEAGRSERVQRLLDTHGIDEAAVGHVEARRLHETEKPVWIELVSSLGLTPQ